ncbi:tetratricopeptide repeat protein, partial [Thermodesulfobacteriota bacterium]
AFHTIGFYIIKTFIPTKLTILYLYPKGYPENFWFASKEFFIALFVIIASILYIVNIKKIRRGVNFGIVLFVATLLPVLRLIPIGESFAADRYMYIPIIGVCFALATSLEYIYIKNDLEKKIICVIGGIFVIFFTLSSYRHIAVFKNSYTLWTNSLKVYPDYPDAKLNIGEYLASHGKLNEAEQYFVEIVDNEKVKQKAMYNLGAVYLDQNRPEEAEELFLELIQEFPENVKSYIQLGNIFDMKRDAKKADSFYKKSLELEPENAYAHHNYAIFLENVSQPALAIKHYKLANKYRPGQPATIAALKRLGALR